MKVLQSTVIKVLTLLLPAILLLLISFKPSFAETLTFSPVADSFIVDRAAERDTNFGDSPTLFLGKDTDGAMAYSYLKFDLSSIPSNAIIQNAKLYLYRVNSSGIGFEMIMKILYDEETWNENLITYNNRPVQQTFPFSLYDLSSISVVEADVTDLVTEWIEENYNNHSFFLGVNGSISSGNAVWFGSKDNSISSRRPKLEINYSVPNDDPEITLLSPTGGEILYINNDFNITWNWEGDPDTRVKITLYKGSVNLGNIWDNCLATREYVTWTVFSYLETGSNYWIKISSKTDSSVNVSADLIL